MPDSKLTLEEFTYRQLRLFPHATGELSALLRDIGLAAKRISLAVSKAALMNITGAAGKQNVHTEEVKLLDVYAHTQVREVLVNGHSCAGIVSEEEESMDVFDDPVNNKSKYVLAFDPLDGSSNIDTNIAVGTIFGVYRRLTAPGTCCGIEDFLQAGIRQVAAGYIIYGTSTMLVYATRRGVNGFTLDPSIGEFCLSHPAIQCPVTASCYAVNHGYYDQYSDSIRGFIRKCQQEGSFSERYAGSMVADMHRTLLKGGIFLYPGTIKKPNGKLRLLYECNPFAFIMEVAGGKAIHDKGRILEKVPRSLHETSAIYTGSIKLVERLTGCI